MDREADIVVIGGGLSGTSIAFHLVRAGKKVVLLEKGPLGSGPSGASFGWVAVHFASYMSEYPDYHMRLMRRALDAYAEIAKEFGEAIGYEVPGGISLIYTREDLEKQAQLAQRLTAAGIDAYIVSREELLKREPALAGPFIGALVSPLEAVVNPLLLVRRFAREAVKHGAEIHTHTPATGIEVQNRAVSGVVTPAGRIRTPVVVNAAGVDSPAIGKMVGLELPVHPNRGQQLVVQGKEGLISAAVHGRVMVRRTCAGNYIVGGVREQAGYHNVVTPAVVAFLAREVTAMIPQLAPLTVTRAFSGLRPVPSDGKPIYGPVPGLGGYFLASLHFGLTLAPLTGRILASCILGEPLDLDLTPYSVGRFL